MTVLDIISIIPDKSLVDLYDSEDNKIAEYDGYCGKDSIPEEYNDKEVIAITPAAEIRAAAIGKLIITIKE